MYSWIASFFNEDSTNNNTLYANQTHQQQTGQQTSKDEWTWIELIDDKEENGLIIIQTDESVRAHNLQEDSSPTKRKRPITRRDVLARKTFRRSLHTDRPLMSRPRPSSIRKLTKAGPLDVQLRRFCKNQQTTSEVLSSTFPTNNLFNIGTSNNQFDCDISYLLNNTTFLKSVLEGILKQEVVALDRSLQQWLDLLMNVGRMKRNEENKRPLAIEWRKKEDEPISIEWRSSPEDDLSDISQGVLIEEIDDIEFELAASDDVIITMVRYPLPRWLRRINTFDLRAEFPEDLKHLKPSDFHQACGQYHVMPIHTCDTLTQVPSWMQRIDIVESRLDKEVTSRISVPSWIRRVCVDDEEVEGCYQLPSWMNRINVDIADPKPITSNWVPQVRGSSSWFSSYSTKWVSTASATSSPPRKWFGATSETSLLLNNGHAHNICNSVINFAMVLATATCKAVETTAVELVHPNAVPNSRLQPNTCATQKKKRALSQSSLTAKHFATRSAKKNKKWLNKVNNVKQIQNNKRQQRYNAKCFSGSKCVRAC